MCIIIPSNIRIFPRFLLVTQCTVTGEACWWTVHPASKQRSEGEKVRVGDDVIFVSVATERYLVSIKALILVEKSMGITHCSKPQRRTVRPLSTLRST